MVSPFDGGASNIIAAVQWAMGQVNRVAAYFGFGSSPRESLFSSFEEYFTSAVVWLLDIFYSAYYSFTCLVTQITSIPLGDPQIMSYCEWDPSARTETTPMVVQQIKKLLTALMLFAVDVALVLFGMWIENLASGRGHEFELPEDENEEDSSGELADWDFHELSDSDDF